MAIPRSDRRNLVPLTAAIAVVTGFALYAHGAASVPGGIAYSGQLRNNGVAANGSHDFVFSLVDGAGNLVAGTPAGCTADTRTTVAVSAGRFDVAGLFGGCTNLDALLYAQSDRKIRIVVDGQTLSPDQPFGSVPYARVASDSGGRLEDRIAALEQKLQPVALRYTQNNVTVQSLASSVVAPVVFHRKDYESASLAGSVTNTGSDWRFTVPAGLGGKYLVTAYVELASANFSQGNELRSWIQVNGTYAAESHSVGGPFTNGQPGVWVTSIVSLLANDTVGIHTFQNSGATVSLHPGRAEGHVQIVRLSE